eukprot:Pgem_evm1s18230
MDNLGENDTMLAANVVAIMFSGFLCITVSFIFPEPSCNWKETTGRIALIEDDAKSRYDPKEAA